jgi:hypothetical protein
MTIGVPATPGMSDFQTWVGKKLSIGEGLATGVLGGTYSDAVLILGPLISSLAAMVWPGLGIDKARFIEACVNLADRDLALDRVSVPLLIQHLEDTGRNAEATALRGTNTAFTFAQASLVICGDDVDLAPDEVARVVPILTMKEIRAHAHATVFYEEVRSSLTHEYQLARRVGSHAMAESAVGVSYVNLLEGSGPFGVDPPITERRMIHFPIPLLAAIARSVSTAVEPLFEKSLTRPVPPVWWVNGG